MFKFVIVWIGMSFGACELIVYSFFIVPPLDRIFKDVLWSLVAVPTLTVPFLIRRAVLDNWNILSFIGIRLSTSRTQGKGKA